MVLLLAHVTSHGFGEDRPQSGFVAPYGAVGRRRRFHLYCADLAAEATPTCRGIPAPAMTGRQSASS
jgi:hypothetical protein